MAVYPESPEPVYPLVVRARWDNIISPTESGPRQARARRLYALYDVTAQYQALSISELQTLYDFWMARKGDFEPFYVFDLSLLAGVVTGHDGLYVGTKDGSTTTYDLPGRSTTSLVMYNNGSTMTLTTDYTVSIGTGEGSADQITLTAAGTAGDVLTCDFNGYARYYCRFADNAIERALYQTDRFNLSVPMVGEDPTG